MAVLQGIVEQYQGSAILEVQARSCEYSHMFKLDGMRAALLEHIPPLDESTYTRNLGNSQVLDAAGAAQVTLHTPCTLASTLHCICCSHFLMHACVVLVRVKSQAVYVSSSSRLSRVYAACHLVESSLGHLVSFQSLPALPVSLCVVRGQRGSLLC